MYCLCSLYFCVVLCIDCFVTFSVLFVCICVLNYCHRVATQLQLNILYYIISTNLSASGMRYIKEIRVFFKLMDQLNFLPVMITCDLQWVNVTMNITILIFMTRRVL